MAASIIGKALVVAWSFTLSNLGSTPQIINLGPAPTDATYVPVEMIVNVANATEKDLQGLTWTFGTSSKNPANIWSYEMSLFPSPKFYYQPGNYNQFEMWGAKSIPADQNLYVEYSIPTPLPTTDQPITIDVLAYPTS